VSIGTFPNVVFKHTLDIFCFPRYNKYMMTTKDTMTNTQKLALAYAEKLVAYYEAMNSDVCDKARVVRVATNEMYDAQNMLAYAAECEAKNA